MPVPSCLFTYEKRLLTRDETGKNIPILLEDGKTEKTNINYINFLQVVSAYWETDQHGKNKLNVFLNTKVGFTLVLPEFLGIPFIDQFWAWSQVFGLSPAPPPQRVIHQNRRDEKHQSPKTKHQAVSRPVNELEFIDPNEAAPQDPAWESEGQ